MKRQIEADALYARTEIENLKDTVKDQKVELEKLRTLANGHEFTFGQLKTYTEENDQKVINAHDRVQVLDTNLNREIAKIKDLEIATKFKRNEDDMNKLRAGIDQSIDAMRDAADKSLDLVRQKVDDTAVVLKNDMETSHKELDGK